MNGVQGIATDSTGHIYVTNTAPSTVTIYPSGSNGDVVPTTTINVQENGLAGIAVDSGGNIYVAFNAGIVVYPPGSSGNATPSAVITDTLPGVCYLCPVNGVAVDQQGDIYATTGSGIVVFPPGSNGNATYTTIITTPPTTPPTIQSFQAIALDSNANIYATGFDATVNALWVFPKGSNGTTTPMVELTSDLDTAGPNSALDSASGIAVDSTGHVYVANNGTNTVFGPTDWSDPASIAIWSQSSILASLPPDSMIWDGVTNITYPIAVALDQSANIYVLNRGFGVPTNSPNGDISPSINVYAAGSNAASAPFRVISAPTSGASDTPGAGEDATDNTGLVFPHGMAVDSGGNIYVLNSGSPGDYITIYASGSSGNVAPTATIGGSLTQLGALSSTDQAIALDGNNNIFVASVSDILVFAAGSSGDVAPSYTITPPSPYSANAVAFDSKGNLYVLTSPSAILVYPPGTNSSSTPSAIISGNMTGLGGATGIGVDGVGNIYVAVNGFKSIGSFVYDGFGSVVMFPPGSNGNVAPTAVITGVNTGLTGSQGIAVIGQPPFTEGSEQLVVNPSKLNFGTVGVGTTSASQTATITSEYNDDNVDLFSTFITPNFVQTGNNCPSVVGPFQSCQVSFACKPKTAGSLIGAYAFLYGSWEPTLFDPDDFRRIGVVQFTCTGS